jgi:hypothetical protein
LNSIWRSPPQLRIGIADSPERFARWWTAVCTAVLLFVAAVSILLRCSQWLYVTGLRYSRESYDVNASALASCSQKQINRWSIRYDAVFGTLAQRLPDLYQSAIVSGCCVAILPRLLTNQILETGVSEIGVLQMHMS